MKRTLSIFAVGVLLISVGYAQSSGTGKVPAVGDWEGKITTAEGTFQLLLHLALSKQGSLVATVDDLSQNEDDIPVDVVSLADSQLHFEISRVGGKYDGLFDPAASKIAGTWKQSGHSMPLEFRRVSHEFVENIKPKLVRVAFLISDNFNIIDFAGPWEVFQDTMDYPNGAMRMLMRTYTVSANHKPVSSGGMQVIAQYTFADAPKPDIIVVGAQSDGSAPVLDWLRRMHSEGATIMSVCTGASKLAESGLIDGLSATTHHDFIKSFEGRYPHVKWQTSRRYVQSADNIYTAAGLTSGIDLALHLVETRYGRKIAQDTAEYLEYHGNDWKQDQQALTPQANNN